MEKCSNDTGFFLKQLTEKLNIKLAIWAILARAIWNDRNKSTLRRPKFSREIFWMEQLVFWGNTRDSWLPTTIHKLLPWCSFLVIGSSGCISKVVSFSISPWLGVCYARGHILFMFSLLDIQNNSIFSLKRTMRFEFL